MLSKLKGKPLWYKLWATASAFAALFVLVRLVYTDELQRVDHALLIFTLTSSILDSFLFPPEEEPKSGATHARQKKRAVVCALAFGIGLVAALFLL